MIREATDLDKNSILAFCRNTFSWGDYVEQVWDAWLSEGHLFLFEKQTPIGICHVSYSKEQVWIEGIRIDPNFRRQKTASELVTHSELLGKQKRILLSYMLIDTENSSSLSMANSLGYNIFQTWNFYSLNSKTNSNFDIEFVKSLDTKIYSHYVKSWRWLPIDDSTLSKFYQKNRIIVSDINGEYSLAILSDSEHFDNNLIVTLFSGSKDTAIQILSFLQNYGQENNCERMQILTKEQLPIFDSLEHRISFHLMKKSLA